LDTRVYHVNVMSGDSIEFKRGEIGTMGIFIRSEDTIIGVAAGHVMNGTDAGSTVVQPALHDFKGICARNRAGSTCKSNRRCHRRTPRIG